MLRCFMLLVVGVCVGAHAEMRTWTLVSGKQVEGEYAKKVMDRVWLTSPAGDIVKIPAEQLSEEDCLYIEWFNPPKLEVEFWSTSSVKLSYYKSTPHLGDKVPPSLSEVSFRARVRQADAAAYHHGLTVTYYAIGRQLLDRDKYILLEKKTGSFTPSEKPEIELTGSDFKMLKYVFRDQNRGRDYAHHLVLVTDERGEVIAHKESAKWLFEHRENLDKLPAGAFMDTTCTRVHPTGPKPQY